MSGGERPGPTAQIADDKSTPAPSCGTIYRMTVQTVLELLRARPFKPFRVVMSSGKSYDIRHPEMAFLTGTDLLVGVRETDYGVPAEFRICPLLHLATVEPVRRAARKRRIRRA